MKIAILGLGAMGSRMAAKLAAGHHQVVVWNRTPRDLGLLAKLDLAVAASPRAAATGADIVISMVRDDEASRRVWLDGQDGALQALDPDALAVECSTLSLPYVRELAGAFSAAQRTFVDAPLAGSRPQADAGQLIFFVGGESLIYERLRPVLEPMAGAVHHAGPTGSGAVVKLMVNALFGAQLAAVAELIGFADRAGVDPTLALEIITNTPVCSPAAKLAAEAMLAGAWAPAFPVQLVAKDFRLLAESARDTGAAVPLCESTGAVYQQGVVRGFGDDNITGIVQLYREAND